MFEITVIASRKHSWQQSNNFSSTFRNSHRLPVSFIIFLSNWSPFWVSHRLSNKPCSYSFSNYEFFFIFSLEYMPPGPPQWQNAIQRLCLSIISHFCSFFSLLLIHDHVPLQYSITEVTVQNSIVTPNLCSTTTIAYQLTLLSTFSTSIVTADQIFFCLDCIYHYNFFTVLEQSRVVLSYGWTKT